MTHDERPSEPNRRIFIPMIVAGWSVIAFGILGLFHNAARTHPGRWVGWFLGGAIVHDALIAPMVFGVALLIGRTPARWRAPIQGTAIASGIVALTAYPFIRGFGRRPDNPSVLPNDYASGLLWALAMIAISAVAIALVSWWRQRGAR